MADRDINIGIKTTGAQQAAQEIDKVTDAMGGSKGNAGLAAGADAATKGMGGLDKTTAKNTRSLGANRAAMQNVGFQVQDLAVQLGSGAGAARAFSQQMPQLLSGFGPLGVLMGTVSAIAIPLAAALFRNGEAAEDAAPKIADLKEAVEALNEAAAEAGNARELETLTDWFQALDDEEAQYENVTAAIKRQIAALAKLQALRSGADAAERQARIAEIEADATKTPEQKISQVAAIRDEEAAARVQAELQKLRDDSGQAFGTAADTSFAAERAAQDAAAAAAEREERERQAEDVEFRARQAAKAAERIEEVEKQISLARGSAASAGASSAFNPSGFDLDAAEETARKIEGLTKELEALQAVVKRAPALLEDVPQAQQLADAARTGEKETRDRAEAARKAADEAASEFAAADELRRAGEAEILRRAEAEQRIRDTQRDAQLRAAEEARIQQEQRAAEQAARQAEALARDAANLGREAAGLVPKGQGGVLPDGITPRLTRAVDATVAGLQDGDQGGELEELARLMERLADAVQGTSAAQDIRLAQIQKKIQILEQRGRAD